MDVRVDVHPPFGGVLFTFPIYVYMYECMFESGHPFLVGFKRKPTGTQPFLSFLILRQTHILMYRDVIVYVVSCFLGLVSREANRPSQVHF